MRIFDLLVAQTVYDKDALIRDLNSEKILDRLSSEKGYLLRIILKSMRAYHASNTIHSKIRGWIQDATFLYDKSVYHASAKLFRKARMKAMEMDDHHVLIEILKWESKLAKVMHQKGLDQELSRIIQHGSEVTDQLIKTQELHRLYNRLILTTFQSNQVRETEGRTKLQEIINSPVLQNEPLGFEALHFYLQIHSLCHQKSGNHEAAYPFQVRLVQHWEEHQVQMQASPTRYKQLLSNTIQLCINTKRMAEIPHLLAQMRRYPSKSVHDEIQVKQITLFDELLYYVYIGDLASLEKLTPEIESWLSQYKNLIGESRKIAFISNLALYYFLAGKPKKGLGRTRWIMDTYKGTQRLDIQYFARIMHLLLHFELGNFKLLEFLTRSAYRYLYGKGVLHHFEKAILKHFRKILELPPEEEKRAILNAMAQELTSLAEDPLVSKAPGVSAILIWVNSKCKGISIREQYVNQTNSKP